MSKFAISAMFILVMLPCSVMGETYKCVLPNGKISYSGQLLQTPGAKCEQMFVKKPPTTTQTEPTPIEAATEKPTTPADASAKPAEKPAADKEQDAKRKKIEADEAKKKADKSAEDKLAEQKIKEENCQNAKNNLRTYQIGSRLTKINEKGEKVFLEDTEIKQKMEQAQKDVDQWCGA